MDCSDPTYMRSAGRVLNPTNCRDCVTKREDSTGLSGGVSRSLLRKEPADFFGCHGLAPWRSTFAATEFRMFCISPKAPEVTLKIFNRRFGNCLRRLRRKKSGRLTVSSERETPPRKAVASFRFLTQSLQLVDCSDLPPTEASFQSLRIPPTAVGGLFRSYLSVHVHLRMMTDCPV